MKAPINYTSFCRSQTILDEQLGKNNTEKLENLIEYFADVFGFPYFILESFNNVQTFKVS